MGEKPEPPDSLSGTSRVSCRLAPPPRTADPFRDHSRVPGLDELKTAFDFEPVFYAKAPRSVYYYTAYGTDGEFTLRRNREAFEWVELIPNRSSDAAGIQTSTELFGARMDFPSWFRPRPVMRCCTPTASSPRIKGRLRRRTAP